MNKVLILDDRPERKKTHMSSMAISKLNDCERKGILTMDSVNTYINLNDVNKDNKDVLLNFFDVYSLLAIHWSWLNYKELVNDVINYAKNNSKHLIVFSGGISQVLLLDDYNRLSLNSASFYTDNLPEFVEKYSTNNMEQPLLSFLYGESWLVPIYMKYRQILWKGISTFGEGYIKETDEAGYLPFESIYGKHIKMFDKPSSKEIIDSLNIEINKLIVSKAVAK